MCILKRLPFTPVILDYFCAPTGLPALAQLSGKTAMEEKLYSIAVILINYNSSDFTLPAVQSIRQRTAPPLDYLVVVVDNNSQPDEYAKLAPLRAYDNVKLVRSRVNLGFAGGNMFGVQFAKARYYYFLNNDCLLLNDCLGVLYAFCENNPRVGLCSGQMYDEHEKLQLTFGADPYSLLDYMKGKLRPGGVVVSSIPNIRYFRALSEIIARAVALHRRGHFRQNPPPVLYPQKHCRHVPGHRLPGAAHGRDAGFQVHPAFPAQPAFPGQTVRQQIPSVRHRRHPGVGIP